MCRATPGPSPSLRCDKPDLRNVLHSNACLRLTCSDAIVSQVLDELGLNMSDELSSKETPLYFLSFSSFVFSCTFAITLCVHSQPCQWQGEPWRRPEERRGRPRPPSWMPMPIWRRDCRTYGNNERSSCWTSALWHCTSIQAYSTSFFYFLFLFCHGVTDGSRPFLWKCCVSKWCFCLRCSHLLRLSSIYSKWRRKKKKHLQPTWSRRSHRHFRVSFKVRPNIPSGRKTICVNISQGMMFSQH